MQERSAHCKKKVERMLKALRHEEPDRVPVSEYYFWPEFMKKWREVNHLSDDVDIHEYYDLDWNISGTDYQPHIKPVEILEETEEQVISRNGFEHITRRKNGAPMDEYVSFAVNTVEEMKSFDLHDPWDERRFEGFQNTLNKMYRNIFVLGNMMEGCEFLWRIISSENMLLWLALYPDDIKRFLDRITVFLTESLRAQIAASGGMLDGMMIWGDVAYTKDMLFSPETWREFFKPCLNELVQICHKSGLPVVYHGCGNVNKIFCDYIDMGIEAYNPLEAKAGLDVVDLRRRFGHRIAFCGNMNVIEWTNAPLDELKRIVLTKLNAAKGGGYIFGSDHSVPDELPPERYEYVLNLVREYGRYPLDLGEYDIHDVF